MTLCWAPSADDRPTFKEIVPMFDSVLRGASRNNRQRYSEQPDGRPESRPRAIERSKTENKYVREWDTGVRQPKPAQRKNPPRKSPSRTRHEFLHTFGIASRNSYRYFVEKLEIGRHKIHKV